MDPVKANGLSNTTVTHYFGPVDSQGKLKSVDTQSVLGALTKEELIYLLVPMLPESRQGERGKAIDLLREYKDTDPDKARVALVERIYEQQKELSDPLFTASMERKIARMNVEIESRENSLKHIMGKFGDKGKENIVRKLESGLQGAYSYYVETKDSEGNDISRKGQFLDGEIGSEKDFSEKVKAHQYEADKPWSIDKSKKVDNPLRHVAQTGILMTDAQFETIIEELPKSSEKQNTETYTQLEGMQYIPKRDMHDFYGLARGEVESLPKKVETASDVVSDGMNYSAFDEIVAQRSQENLKAAQDRLRALQKKVHAEFVEDGKSKFTISTDDLNLEEELKKAVEINKKYGSLILPETVEKISKFVPNVAERLHELDPSFKSLSQAYKEKISTIEKIPTNSGLFYTHRYEAPRYEAPRYRSPDFDRLVSTLSNESRINNKIEKLHSSMSEATGEKKTKLLKELGKLAKDHHTFKEVSNNRIARYVSDIAEKKAYEDIKVAYAPHIKELKAIAKQFDEVRSPQKNNDAVVPLLHSELQKIPEDKRQMFLKRMEVLNSFNAPSVNAVEKAVLNQALRAFKDAGGIPGSNHVLENREKTTAFEIAYGANMLGFSKYGDNFRRNREVLGNDAFLSATPEQIDALKKYAHTKYLEYRNSELEVFSKLLQTHFVDANERKRFLSSIAKPRDINEESLTSLANKLVEGKEPLTDKESDAVYDAIHSNDYAISTGRISSYSLMVDFRNDPETNRRVMALAGAQREMNGNYTDPEKLKKAFNENYEKVKDTKEYDGSSTVTTANNTTLQEVALIADTLQLNNTGKDVQAGKLDFTGLSQFYLEREQTREMMAELRSENYAIRGAGLERNSVENFNRVQKENTERETLKEQKRKKLDEVDKLNPLPKVEDPLLNPELMHIPELEVILPEINKAGAFIPDDVKNQAKNALDEVRNGKTEKNPESPPMPLKNRAMQR